jgi:hypothetical protein
MRRASGALAALLAVSVSLTGWLPLAGCTASSPAPRGSRRTIEQAQRDPRGAWINIRTDTGEVAGELLAVEQSAVVVASTAGFQRVPVARIREWTLAWYEASNSGVLGYNVIGTLSTLSHGFWLVFTAPLLWILPGTVIARQQSRQGYESSRSGDPVAHLALARYARFPAGLPPGFDPSAPPPEGGPDQPCYPNQTCNRGLACDRGVCRPVPPASPPAGTLP